MEQFEIASEGIDWLRATTPHIEVAERWRATCEIIAELRTLLDIDKKASRRLGYVGFGVEQLFYGKRDDGWLIDLSSETAREFSDTILTHGGRGSRLDLQVTVRAGDLRKQLLSEAFGQVLAHPAKSGAMVDVEMRVGRWGPRSVTIGKRTSDFYGRIYDKQEQSKDDLWEGCLRYEVEVKGDQAHALYDEIRCHPLDLIWQRAFCIEYFARYGVTVPAPPTTPSKYVPYVRPLSDVERQRAWLAKSVRPTVQKLVIDIGEEQMYDDLIGGVPVPPPFREEAWQGEIERTGYVEMRNYEF